MARHFHSIFNRTGSVAARAKFLSRVFGIFSEEIVRIWAANRNAPYEDCGRPTITLPDLSGRHTLDFALCDRKTKRIYVAEMKCEIEYQNFKYFVLESYDQLAHHTKPAFGAFLKAAIPSNSVSVSVRGKPVKSDGAILIWGAASPEGRDSVMKSTSLHDVLTVEGMCRELAAWKDEAFQNLLDDRWGWCQQLFEGLRFKHASDD